MAQEPFLINPPRKRRKRKSTAKSTPKRKSGGTRKRKRRSTLPRTASAGKHRPVVYGTGKSWSRSSYSRSKRRGVSVNPGLAIVGGYNPMRGYRRRRRNPMSVGSAVGTFQRTLPYAITGIASSVVTNMVPGFLGNFTSQLGPTGAQWANYGIKSAVAVFGGPMIDRFIGRGHGNVWTIVGITVVVSDMIRDFLPGIIPGLGGYADYSDQFGYADSGISAYPEEVNAYPEEMSSFDQPWPYSGTHEYGY